MVVQEEGFYFVYSQVKLFVVISLYFHRRVLLLCLLITRIYNVNLQHLKSVNPEKNEQSSLFNFIESYTKAPT